VKGTGIKEIWIIAKYSQWFYVLAEVKGAARINDAMFLHVIDAIKDTKNFS
jgi:hypothetical protein